MGWTHAAAVGELEAKRKEASKTFYNAKKKLLVRRAKAAAQVAKA